MSFFSQQSKNEIRGTAGIPPEILRAVSVMGDTENPVLSKGEAKESLPPNAASASPFLSDTSSGSTDVASIKPPVASVPASWSPAASVPSRLLSSQESGLKITEIHRKKWLFLALGGIIVALMGGGAWYFMKTAPAEKEEVKEVPLPPSPPVVSLIVTPEPPFALDAPNYFPLDTETITAQALKQLLDQAAVRIIAAGVTQPVEFLPTDKNNNPLAFSRFAYLMGLDLSQELLETLGESFSLFLYTDQGKVHLGLRLTFVNGTTGSGLVRKEENKLPLLFRNLLFEGVALPKEILFRSGVYQTESVRFVNIDVTQNISFDYVLRSSEWLIGTSKETLRALVDKKP